MRFNPEPPVAEVTGSEGETQVMTWQGTLTDDLSGEATGNKLMTDGEGRGWERNQTERTGTRTRRL